jgi:monoamine oxidase
MEPVRDRLFFAGEAVHETLWGTVGGAWESGERAADAALRLWGGAPGGTGAAAPSRTRRR